MNCDSVPAHNTRKRKRTRNSLETAKVYRQQEPRAADSPQVQKVDLRSQLSTPPPDLLQVSDLQPSSQPSSPAPELQVQGSSPQPSAASLQALTLFPQPASPTPDDVQQDTVTEGHAPLKIHGYSVEEYQKIYHSVVDGMFKYKTGRPRPYSLQLGRVIKQRLWETLGCPKITTTEMPDGLLVIEESQSKEVYPPLIEVDISKNPKPRGLFRKRAKL